MRLKSPQSNDPPPAGWTSLGMVEIANYAALRRHVGKARAERLANDVAAFIRLHESHLVLTVCSRERIEFTFDGRTNDELLCVATRVSKIFDSALDIDGEQLPIRLAVAGVTAPHGNTEEVRLIEEAEAAIVEALASERIIIRNLLLGTPAFDRHSLIRDLPQAIANGEMFLQYQPKVNIRRQEVASAEALIRWQHPARGLVLPGDFIQVAEETNTIDALTRWTLERVICDQRRLAVEGHDLTLFINVSGKLLADHDFIEYACTQIASTKAKIGFEVTETAVISDPETAITNLKRLSENGITIAIDDYGAGLSSLAYLKRLPASELKIDKMFVLQLTSSNRDPLIVRSTIDLAHAMDMEVTAEGVETQAALALLSVMGCDMAQGYLLSRPLSIDAFDRFLKQDFHSLVGGHAPGALHRPASFWASA